MNKLWIYGLLGSFWLGVASPSFAASVDAYVAADASPAAAETNYCDTSTTSYTYDADATAYQLLMNLCQSTDTMTAAVAASVTAASNSAGTMKTNAQVALGASSATTNAYR